MREREAKRRHASAGPGRPADKWQGHAALRLCPPPSSHCSMPQSRFIWTPLPCSAFNFTLTMFLYSTVLKQPEPWQELRYYIKLKTLQSQTFIFRIDTCYIKLLYNLKILLGRLIMLILNIQGPVNTFANATANQLSKI